MLYNVIKTGTQGQRLRPTYNGKYRYTGDPGYNFDLETAEQLALLYNGYIVEISDIDCLGRCML